MPGRPFIVFHLSLSRPIKVEGDVDADTSQGQLFVWCIWERSFIREAGFSITNEKQAGEALTTAEYIDVSLLAETKKQSHVFVPVALKNKPSVQGKSIS